MLILWAEFASVSLSVNCLPQSTGVEEEVPSSHYSGGPKILASFGYFIRFLSEIICLRWYILFLEHYFVGVREAVGFFITIIITDSSETLCFSWRRSVAMDIQEFVFSEVVNL